MTRSRPLIVVADPNESTRELLCVVFREEMNAWVTLLQNASELGPALREAIPALVVVEVGLDRVADVAVIAEIRRLHPGIPVLVLTAWGVDSAMAAERSAADTVIAKPFDLDDLIERAKELATRPR